MTVSPCVHFGALQICFRRLAILPVKEAQIAGLGKFCYLLVEQSFPYVGRTMAGRFLRELTIRQLRALAALRLIQRTTDGMLLTDAGREVLALTERIEAAIVSCDTSLDMIAGKTAGRISIGAVSTAKYFVPFAISGFSKVYPNIDVTLSIGNRQE